MEVTGRKLQLLMRLYILFKSNKRRNVYPTLTITGGANFTSFALSNLLAFRSTLLIAGQEVSNALSLHAAAMDKIAVRTVSLYTALGGGWR